MNFRLYSGLALTLILALTPVSAPCSPLLEFDFNDSKSWPTAYADVMPSTPIDLATTFEVQPGIGTPDAMHPGAASSALLVGAQVGEVELNWTATYASGLFPVKDTQTDLNQLKLGLNLSASAAHPLKLQIESFDTKKHRTGGLETVLTPTAADTFEHLDLNLASFKPVGAGKFQPNDPFVQFSFILEAPAWPNQASHQLRVDDLTYSTTESNTTP